MDPKNNFPIMNPARISTIMVGTFLILKRVMLTGTSQAKARTTNSGIKLKSKDMVSNIFFVMADDGMAFCLQ